MYNFICSFLRTVELFQERLNAEQVAAAAGMVTTTHAMITADGQTVAVNYDPATGQYVTPDGQVGSLLHSVSSNRDKIRVSVKNRRQYVVCLLQNIRDKNSLFLTFLLVFYVVESHNSSNKIHFSKFFGQKQGPGTSVKCEKIRDSTSVKIRLKSDGNKLSVFSNIPSGSRFTVLMNELFSGIHDCDSW